MQMTLNLNIYITEYKVDHNLWTIANTKEY